MAAKFSGAVKLGDLNDFIAPSQACVVKLNGGKVDQLSADVRTKAEEVQLQPRAPKAGGFSQTLPTSSPTDPIKVTLHDCLACSGCVTTAETILLEHQSVDELMSKLTDPAVHVVMSISPQSRASLGMYHGISTTQVFARLTGFLKSLGVRNVFDTNVGREVSLRETAVEFLQRYRASPRGAAHLAHERDAGGAQPMDVDFRPTTARGGPEAEDKLSNGHAFEQRHPPGQIGRGSGGPAVPGWQSGMAAGADVAMGADVEAGPLPMLASACPGWVCYAEKTHGDYILPYISTTKSPQAVMGSAVKRWLAQLWGLDPAQLYHCTVMPCYDKKLEASREDFFLPGTSVSEVDCVLTTGELQELLESKGADLKALPEVPLEGFLTSLGPDGCLHGVRGGAGGYLEHLYRTMAWEAFGVAVPPGPLPMRLGRNPDLREVELVVGDRVVARFAAAYGFRNIQTLMRKIKRGVCEYDYVEVMACPSGCLNGGGQLKLPKRGTSAAEAIQKIEEVYLGEMDEAGEGGGECGAARELYQEWVQDDPGGPRARELLHTGYHKRDKTVLAAMSDW